MSEKRGSRTSPRPKYSVVSWKESGVKRGNSCLQDTKIHDLHSEKKEKPMASLEALVVQQAISPVLIQHSKFLQPREIYEFNPIQGQTVHQPAIINRFLPFSRRPHTTQNLSIVFHQILLKPLNSLSSTLELISTTTTTTYRHHCTTMYMQYKFVFTTRPYEMDWIHLLH